MKKQLTKQDLVDLGIKVELVGDEYKVYHYGPITGYAKQKVWKPIKISTATCKHKYGVDRVYPIVAFSNKGKMVSIILSRLVYAWFKGDIPEGMDVDHIDNNPFNNKLDNLQLLSHKENIRKREQSNNQYNCKWTNEDRATINDYKYHIEQCKVIKMHLRKEYELICASIKQCDNIEEWRELTKTRKVNRSEWKQLITLHKALKQELLDYKKSIKGE